MTAQLTDRLRREIEHGSKDIALRQAEAGWDSPAGRMRRDRRATFLLNQLPRSARVLEIGAGTGLHTLSLLAAIDDVTAIDISPDLLEVARRRAPGAKYHLMDGHAPEFSAGTFDAILGVSILHHLNWHTALANCFQLLKPNGIIRFSEPNLLNPQIYLQKNIPLLKRLAGDSPDEYAFTRWQIARSLREIGFAAISVRPFEFLHPATPERLIPLVMKVEDWVSRTALNEVAGSLLIEAKKP
jgi:2-polyprenyl-3-methyl-5-hydroxy-6-metoxy-1,4-benzoquinol methylase